MTEWLKRHAECIAADDDETDERFRADWIKEYCAAFVSFALSRGWERSCAESWLPDLAHDAFFERETLCPEIEARADVYRIERKEV